MPSPVKPTEWDSFFGEQLGKRRDGPTPPGTGVLGMSLFLVSLGVLFLASLVGYLVVRSRAGEWQPEGAADLPWTLWISTAVILISSATIHGALGDVRRDRLDRLSRGLLVTLALGWTFLALQIAAWIQLVAAGVTASSSLYAFMFYVFTTLHALHVIGGLIPLTVVTRRARRHAYTPEAHPGIIYVTMYWHFLDGVWLVLFAALVVFG